MTASGKSLFGRRLAQRLGFGYVSASQILFDRMNFPPNERDRAWTAHFDEIANARNSTSLDTEVDQELLRVSSQCDHLVIDSWVLPWLVDESALKLWISCDEETRCKKARISDARWDKPLAYYRFILARKDEDSRRRFSSLYGFSYGPDPAVFDHILDNSEYYAEPSSLRSAHMMDEFSDLLLSIVLSEMNLPIGAA